MNSFSFIDKNFTNKTVLIAPLNWGLGHATRCIPIIKKLVKNNCKVFIASDGEALFLLQKEFPDLTFLELPSYGITYSKYAFLFKFKLLLQSFSVLKILEKEKNLIEDWIHEFSIDILISDNRFGVYSSLIPSVYITHQINVLSGFTTRITSHLHKKIIEKYTFCWVPDFDNSLQNKCLAGKLSQQKLNNTHFIGPLSRLKKKDLTPDFNVLILLSGPEPQRSILEKKLILEFTNKQKSVVFVKGIVQEKQIIETKNNITFYNFATSEQVSDLINRCEIVICRSGYTTIMDLSILQKMAILIPTPGQSEQEYLAKRLHDLELLPSISQRDFTYESLNIIDKYKGLPTW